jgi:hypothetical protein
MTLKTNTPFESALPGKKYSVYASDGKKIKLIHFGAKGYEDFTTHKDEERRKKYIKRHEAKENWGRSGLFTAGFWSRWILWNLPSQKESISYTQQFFYLPVLPLKK